ncbi:NUDIX hydrolase domain-like protein [Peziza echinospora]|nr:NUDIX hydrolase domain-like protein [Peziza echinospora]
MSTSDTPPTTWPTLHPPPTLTPTSPPLTIPYHPSLTPYHLPIPTLLATGLPPSPSPWPTTTTPLHPSLLSPTTTTSAKPDHLAAGAYILHNSTLLLLLRSPTEPAFPSLWEIPGGGADPALDATLLHTVVREVYEETGLVVSRFVEPWVAVQGFAGRGGGRLWGKVSFVVEVEEGGEVRLDAREHSAWRWVAGVGEVEEVVRGEGFTAGEMEGWVRRVVGVIESGGLTL